MLCQYVHSLIAPIHQLQNNPYLGIYIAVVCFAFVLATFVDTLSSGCDVAPCRGNDIHQTSTDQGVQCSDHGVQCSEHGVQCSECTFQCSVFSVKFSVVCSFQCAVKGSICSVCKEKYTQCNVPCTEGSEETTPIREHIRALTTGFEVVQQDTAKTVLQF